MIGGKSLLFLLDLLEKIKAGKKCIMFGPQYVIMSKGVYDKLTEGGDVEMAKATPKPKRKPGKPAPKSKPKK